MRKRKIIAYVIAWLAALFATNPRGDLWPVAWMFPLGLFAALPPGTIDDGRVVLILGFAIYIAHGIFFFRAPTPRSSLVWFAVLILLLFANVPGCRSMNHPY